MYTVEIDWAPAYELLVSLQAYLSTQDHKTLELGNAWVRDVRRRLTPEFNAALLNWKRLDDGLSVLNLVIRHCPGDRTAQEFVEWLPNVSTGQLYEWIEPFVSAAESASLVDLGGIRDRSAFILHEWHRQYFADIDPAILRGLEDDAARKRARLPEMSPQEFVEMATNGVTIAPDAEIDTLFLVPQYHYRPWNLNAYFHGQHLMQYPVDALPLDPEDVSPQLRRLTRALADDSRLRILRLLSSGPTTFSSVVSAMQLSKSTVNYHLVMLRAAGLVRVHHAGPHSSTYTLQAAGVEQLTDELRAYLFHD